MAFVAILPIPVYGPAVRLVKIYDMIVEITINNSI